MYKLERVMAHVQYLHAPAGHMLYQIKLFGYVESTQKTSQNLRYNMTGKYRNRHKIYIPPNVGDSIEI